MLLAQATDAVYGGINGFLGTRASVMLDVVFIAMFLVIPVMGIAIAAARFGNRWELHRRIQLTLGTVLLLAVVAFEVDMQFVTEWELRAEPSPYFDPAAKWSCPVGISLLVHLFFAVPTTLLWIYVIAGAQRNFPQPATPSAYSNHHKFWARLAAFEMTMTAITGWVFYVMAFVIS